MHVARQHASSALFKSACSIAAWCMPASLAPLENLCVYLMTRLLTRACRACCFASVQHCVKGTWRDSYWFSLAPVTSTVLQACSAFSFRQHPLFTQHMIVSRVVPGGRISLYDFALRTRLQGQPAEERQLMSEDEGDSVLGDVLGLDLSLPAVPL